MTGMSEIIYELGNNEKEQTFGNNYMRPFISPQTKHKLFFLNIFICHMGCVTTHIFRYI